MNHGRPLTRQPDPALAATAARRFWTKVDRSDGCWEWTAATNGVGYGVLTMSRAGLKVLAHRFSYELHKGPIPDGLVIDHCKRGHSLSGDNLHITPAGKRHCRACHRDYERERYRRLRAEQLGLVSCSAGTA